MERALLLTVACTVLVFLIGSMVGEAMTQQPSGKPNANSSRRKNQNRQNRGAQNTSSNDSGKGNTNRGRAATEDGDPKKETAANAASPQNSETSPPASSSEGAKPGTELPGLGRAQWGFTIGLGIISAGLIVLSFFTASLSKRTRLLKKKTTAVELTLASIERTTPPLAGPPSHGNNQPEKSKGTDVEKQLEGPSSDNETEVSSDSDLSVKEVEDLRKRFSDLEERVKRLETPDQTDPQDQPLVEIVDVLPILEPPKSATVENMLEWARDAGLGLETVKADFSLFGNFAKSDDGDNWLAIGNGECYLFPLVNRFESASHYNSLYSQYYICDRPSAGTILIEQPAAVSADLDQGGWKLINKGKLSVAL